jgi:hypothetical protein
LGKARGRDTQDNWAIGNSPIKTDMVLENLKNYPCKDTVSELTEGFLNGFHFHMYFYSDMHNKGDVQNN